MYQDVIQANTPEEHQRNHNVDVYRHVTKNTFAVAL